MTDKIAAANKALVRRFYKDVYVDWNMAMVDEVVSPRFTSHDWPDDGRSGPMAFRDYYAAIRSAVPDARYEVDDLIAEGDKVVVLGQATWHAKQTGRSFDTPFIHVFTLSDGKIARFEARADTAAGERAFRLDQPGQASASSQLHH